MKRDNPQHSQEPWRIPVANIFRVMAPNQQNENGTAVVCDTSPESVGGEYAAGNARRIMACVNACKGMQTSALSNMMLGELEVVIYEMITQFNRMPTGTEIPVWVLQGMEGMKHYFKQLYPAYKAVNYKIFKEMKTTIAECDPVTITTASESVKAVNERLKAQCEQFRRERIEARKRNMIRLKMLSAAFIVLGAWRWLTRR